jgi:microcystin-dependent protein
MFGGNFEINGWAFCDGRLLAISENPTLFQLIGTTYGGDGQTTFALPDLRGRLPIHQGQGQGLSNYVIGENAGVESVTLTLNQIPAHTHPPGCNSGAGNQQGPGNGVWAAPSTGTIYSDVAPSLVMDPAAAGPLAGGSQPHDNIMPILCVNFIISLFGVFPTQT